MLMNPEYSSSKSSVTGDTGGGIGAVEGSISVNFRRFC